MSATQECKRRVINATKANLLKLHTAYPGLTGANELSGGAPAYVAKACSYPDSASGEAVSLSAAVVFDVPASTVKWVTAWDGAAMLWLCPNGGSPKDFFVDLASNTAHSAAHGFVNGDIVTPYPSTPPGGLTAGGEYFVVNATADTFQFSLTAGGAAINITSAHSDDCRVSKLVPAVYASQDTHTISDFQRGAPF